MPWYHYGWISIRSTCLFQLTRPLWSFQSPSASENSPLVACSWPLKLPTGRIWPVYGTLGKKKSYPFLAFINYSRCFGEKSLSSQGLPSRCFAAPVARRASSVHPVWPPQSVSVINSLLLCLGCKATLQRTRRTCPVEELASSGWWKVDCFLHLWTFPALCHVMSVCFGFGPAFAAVPISSNSILHLNCELFWLNGQGFFFIRKKKKLQSDNPNPRLYYVGTR